MVADSCHWIFSIYKRKQKEIQNEINKKFWAKPIERGKKDKQMQS